MFSHLCYSQELKDKLSRDMCSCMSELDFAQLEGKSQYPFTCFEKAAVKYKSEWETLIDTTGKQSSGQQERAFMQSLYSEVQDGLMSNCDIFYHFIDTIRYVDLKYMIPKDPIDTLNSFIEKHPDSPDNILNRGLLYFKQEAYDLANKDFDKVLELDSLHLHALYFKGWTLETTKDYDQAITYYKKFKELSGILPVDAVIRICERKKALAE